MLFGASRRPAFLRFRTNDVLLGTLGAGVHICGVSNSYFYYFLGYIYAVRTRAPIPSEPWIAQLVDRAARMGAEPEFEPQWPNGMGSPI